MTPEEQGVIQAFTTFQAKAEAAMALVTQTLEALVAQQCCQRKALEVLGARLERLEWASRPVPSGGEVH